MDKPVRVLIVDDSILFRTKLQFSLMEDRQIKVVGSAADPVEAMKKITELNPDVVTLDVEMPKMSGIEFLKQLIPKRPVPVVVVSSLPINALDALDAGAIDFVKKPVVQRPGDLDSFITELKNKIKVAATAKVSQAGKPVVPKSTLISRLPAKMLNVKDKDAIIAIGASTGGTEAIISVVKNLPASTPGIVIVQHMPANFTTLYAQRLDKICKMHAVEASDYERVEQGKIILGAGEFHLTLKKDARGYFVRSQQGEKVSGHCPSVDVLFDSVADTAGKHAIGVILTGMGADGARGITKMRRAGAYTIGQDRASCVVYGMPMEAFKMGGVAKQLPLDQIGDEIIYTLNR